MDGIYSYLHEVQDGQILFLTSLKSSKMEDFMEVREKATKMVMAMTPLQSVENHCFRSIFLSCMNLDDF